LSGRPVNRVLKLQGSRSFLSRQEGRGLDGRRMNRSIPADV
jgi:hypothetical protein